MTEGLGDFFKIIAEDKKKKKEEFDNLVGLDQLDSLISQKSRDLLKRTRS